MNGPNVYRTETGTIMRTSEDEDGRLSVELLEAGEWVPGPIRMAGLRMSTTTTRLTARQVRRLPE